MTEKTMREIVETQEKENKKLQKLLNESEKINSSLTQKSFNENSIVEEYQRRIMSLA